MGPVVQSVVSLTSSLRVISLTVLADSLYNILIFFAEKMWVAFALQKLLTFFQQKFLIRSCVCQMVQVLRYLFSWYVRTLNFNSKWNNLLGAEICKLTSFFFFYFISMKNFVCLPELSFSYQQYFSHAELSSRERKKRRMRKKRPQP